MPGTRNRRDTLLAAALNSFTQRGYDATSVAELATATGMSKAAVSYHFRSKNDLLHAVADPLLDRHLPLRPAELDPYLVGMGSDIVIPGRMLRCAARGGDDIPTALAVLEARHRVGALSP